MTNTQPAWTPLAALAPRFAANVDALAGRRPDLADQLRSLEPAYLIATAGDEIRLGVPAEAGRVRPLPCSLSPARATATATALFPAGEYDAPVLVAGEDQGWLWDRLYRLPARSPTGYRRPLYLAIADLERLWVLLHVHDWRDLLADARVCLFVGADAVEQLGRSMADDWTLLWPKQWVTLDPTFWPVGVTFDSLQARAAHERLRTGQTLTAPATAAGAATIAARVAGGGPLRVLGLTSRYTTFLQHSMRDWLAGFAALGHDTRLQIEEADHHACSPLLDAQTCRDFGPDLIVVIDHCRAELPGLPAHVPVVMWVQDRLPTIYRPEAGAAQGELDFCLGSGRLHLTTQCGYPAERFLTCPLGTNVERYDARPPSAAEMARYGCDVSYVSHASETADAIVADARRIAEPAIACLLGAVLPRMRAHYAADARILTDVLLRRIVAAAETDIGVRVVEASLPTLLDFLTQRVNNALVRHQALLWLADLGLDLRLYGRGWDRHPQLARFARGVADNQTELATIYRCSAINLQVTPYGCVHQRMLDGLTAGGFFLARWNQGDSMGTAHQSIWAWCGANGITDGADLQRRATPAVADRIARVDELHGFDLAAEGVSLYDAVRTAADSGFVVSADSIWGDDYDRVAFRSKDELHAKIAAALADPTGRRDVAARMRAVVVERFSYARITARLLGMIAGQMARRRTPTLAEAA